MCGLLQREKSGILQELRLLLSQNQTSSTSSRNMISSPYQTIKCPIQSVVDDAKMRTAIEQRVLFVSKMMHRGSHLVLLTAVHCYNADIPSPSP